MSFASLPYEIRSYIWSLAVEPRHITNVREKKRTEKFRKKHRMRRKDVLYETTSAPPPAVMHVCRESRQNAPYQKAFTVGTEPRWTWVNFELDIFCVTSIWRLEDIVSHRSEVQRLQIRTEDDLNWYDAATIYGGLKILLEFVSLKDVRIVLEPGDLMWADVFTEWGMVGCPKETVTFLDEGSGIVFTGEQLNMVGDWRMFFSFDSDGNPPEADELSEQTQWALDDYSHLTLAQMYEMD